MKVFLIAAMSTDGFIARNESELADWTSKEDKRLFVELTKRAGVMVMGGTTYRTIGKPLPGRRNIVYSRRAIDQPGVEFTRESPQSLVARLKGEGCKELAVCGGATIYNMFLKAGVVDELYLTIEPILFGEGISLLDSSIDMKLTLIETRLLSNNIVLNHYNTR
jgi:dihydrofolate reductase